MKRIFLIRHGQSEGNKRMVGGTTEEQYKNDCEIELTKVGILQAYAISNILYDKYGPFDEKSTELWNSPFKRARQTASIINEKLNLKKVFEDPRLAEHDYGNFDFQFMSRWKEISPHSYFVDMMRYKSRHARFFARIEGGESLSDVYNRISLFDLSRVRGSSNEQIIVTHGDFILVALMYFTGQKVEFVYDFNETIPNCCCFVLERKDWSDLFEIKDKIVLKNVNMG